MAEKILNTRIQLKIDELSAWESSTIGLKKGEIAIATISATEGKELVEPVIMIKIGEDGIKTFSQLPWALHAKASDVYGWAKQSSTQFADNFLTMVGADGKTMQAKLDAIFATDAALSTAVSQLQGELTTALANYYTKTEVDGLVAGAKTYAEQKASAAESTAKAYTDQEINKITTGAGYATTKYVDEAVAGHTSAVNTKFESYSTTAQMNEAIDAAVLVETNRAKAAEEALGERVSTASAQALTDAKKYTDDKLTEANLAQYTTEQEVKDIVDGVISAAADVETTISGLTELVDYIEKHGGDASAMATDIGTLKGKVEVIEKKPAYEITATQISNWDGEVGAKTAAAAAQKTADDYAAAHANDYTNAQIDAAIDADVKAAIDAEVERAEAAYATAAQGVKADNAFANVTNTFGDASTYLEEGLEEWVYIEGKNIFTLDATGVDICDAAGNVVMHSAGQASGESFAGLAPGVYTVIITESGMNSAPTGDSRKLYVDYTPVGVALGSATNTNEQFVKFSGSDITIEAKDNKEIAFNIANGAITETKLSASVNESLDKADSALQTVVANDTADKKSGIKVTERNKIEIDDSITWIFNCGGAE